MHPIAARHWLYLGFGAHDDLPAPGGVGGAYALAPHNRGAGGEVGARDMLHQLIYAGVGMIYQVDNRVADFGRVVRRDVGSHTHRDAGGAVYHQIGQARGQHYGFAQCAVEVVYEIDGVLVDVDQHLFGDRSQPRLGVAHRGGRVVVNAAEIALPVHKRQPHREVLRQPHHRLIHRVVVVRMILAQNLAHQPRALLVRLRGAHPQLVHRVQDAPLNRL